VSADCRSNLSTSLYRPTPICNSPRAIENLRDLNRLDELIVEKRLGKRASAKKNRRNRHYEKQFIRNILAHHLELDPTNAADQEEATVDILPALNGEVLRANRINF
jgi:hypothetical protein